MFDIFIEYGDVVFDKIKLNPIKHLLFQWLKYVPVGKPDISTVNINWAVTSLNNCINGKFKVLHKNYLFQHSYIRYNCIKITTCSTIYDIRTWIFKKLFVKNPDEHSG